MVIRSLFDGEIFAVHNPHQDTMSTPRPEVLFIGLSYDLLLVVNLKIYKDLIFFALITLITPCDGTRVRLSFFFRWAKEAFDHVRKKNSPRCLIPLGHSSTAITVLTLSVKKCLNNVLNAADYSQNTPPQVLWTVITNTPPLIFTVLRLHHLLWKSFKDCTTFSTHSTVCRHHQCIGH